MSKSDSDPNPICEHGQLARQCETCDAYQRGLRDGRGGLSANVAHAIKTLRYGAGECSSVKRCARSMLAVALSLEQALQAFPIDPGQPQEGQGDA